MFMESTQIDAAKTVGQIQALLCKFGVTQMLTDYEGGQVSGLSFRIDVDGVSLPFMLPCRWRQVKAALVKKKKSMAKRPDLDDIARRVAWRQIFRWIEAQIALIQTNMVKVQEVFLPYLMLPSGQTAFEHIEGQKFKAIGYGKEGA